MKTSKLVASGLLIALLSPASTRAQVTIDVSKITCDQFVQLDRQRRAGPEALWDPFPTSNQGYIGLQAHW